MILVNGEELFEKGGYVMGFMVGIEVGMEREEKNRGGRIGEVGILLGGSGMKIGEIFMKGEWLNIGRKDRIMNVLNDWS